MLKPTVFITGIAGNLGLRLLPQLEAFSVAGFDLVPPRTQLPHNFIHMDFGEEKSCRDFYHLIREHRPAAVVHLAFAKGRDQKRNGVSDVDRMWRINVAGAARVLEAIAEANRPPERLVSQFIFPSSVTAYGSGLPRLVSEDHPLGAHSFPFAVHKMESDLVVQKWAASLRGAGSYILRAHFPAGADQRNYLVSALRGTPTGANQRAEQMRREGVRLPFILPIGRKYLEHELQFVHLDDIARLIAHILERGPAKDTLTILNVAGKGEPLSVGHCVEIAGTKLTRLPGKWASGKALEFRWNRGISDVPPEALPYLTESYTMNTSRLQTFLGSEYENVMRYTVEDAFRESVASDQ